MGSHGAILQPFVFCLLKSRPRCFVFVELNLGHSRTHATHTHTKKDNSIVTVATIILSIHFQETYSSFSFLNGKMTNRTRTTPAPTTISIIHPSSRILELTNQSFNTHGKHSTVHHFAGIMTKKKKKTHNRSNHSQHHPSISRIPILTKPVFLHIRQT